MLSMTGYGRAMRELDGRQLTIELKSVNHRFLDLSFRMPRNLMFLEDDARKRIGARLSRGHVDVFMTYRNMRSDARSLNLSNSVAIVTYEVLRQHGFEHLLDHGALTGREEAPGAWMDYL